MADEKKPTSPALTNPDQAAEAEEAAKKAREEAVKEQDNPPQPWPTAEELDKQKKEGGPIPAEDTGEGDDAEAQRKKAEAAKTTRSVEADKPAGGYTTR